MSQRRVLREQKRARALVAIAIFLVVCGVASFAVDREASDNGPVVLGGAFIAAAIAAGLMARRGIEVEPDGFTLRYALRRRTLRWDEVLSFSVETVRPHGRERQERPVARLASGEVLILPGADPMWMPSQAPHLVLNQLEALRLRAQHTGPVG